jgi:hypothetical protein
VLARVHSHASHDVRACLGSLLDQGGANGGADDGAEVHRWCGELQVSYRPFWQVLIQVVPPVRLSTDAVFAGDLMLIIRGQSNEVGGITVDEKGRYLTCHKIMAKKV